MIRILEHGDAELRDYATVSIAFMVRETFVVDLSSPATIPSRRTIDPPYIKDYDAHPGDSPLDWRSRFDLSNWRFFAALDDGRRVGAAAIAFRSPDVEMLEGRDDLAVLWDLRVAPEARGEGVGRMLVVAAERWVLAQGGRRLHVETQNTNVPACLFYERMGFTLRHAKADAYPEAPHELQLIWGKDLL